MAAKAALSHSGGDGSDSSDDSDGETAFSPYLSAHALPLLYTNLAGEMIYVLSTRLAATPNITEERRRKRKYARTTCTGSEIFFRQRV